MIRYLRWFLIAIWLTIILQTHCSAGYSDHLSDDAVAIALNSMPDEVESIAVVSGSNNWYDHFMVQGMGTEMWLDYLAAKNVGPLGNRKASDIQTSVLVRMKNGSNVNFVFLKDKTKHEVEVSMGLLEKCKTSKSKNGCAIYACDENSTIASLGSGCYLGAENRELVEKIALNWKTKLRTYQPILGEGRVWSHLKQNAKYWGIHCGLDRKFCYSFEPSNRLYELVELTEPKEQEPIELALFNRFKSESDASYKPDPSMKIDRPEHGVRRICVIDSQQCCFPLMPTFGYFEQLEPRRD